MGDSQIKTPQPPANERISTGNQWLEDDSFPFEMVPFFGHMLILRGVQNLYQQKNQSFRFSIDHLLNCPSLGKKSLSMIDSKCTFTTFCMEKLFQKFNQQESLGKEADQTLRSPSMQKPGGGK